MGKWFRVIDPLSPLYGCDIRLGLGLARVNPDDFSVKSFGVVVAMRRVDVFVGDRPFQLIAKEGEDLGLMIDKSQLEDSPLQDETVETGTDRPHGLCIDESEMTRGDGVTLRVARYERAVQIAVEDSEGELRATNTAVGGTRDVWEKVIVDMFEAGADVDDITYALENN